MFADQYLERKGRKREILQEPDENTGIIVVVPCFREENILETLESLYCCDPPGQKTEVIILINHPEDAGEEVKKINNATKTSIDEWRRGKKDSGIRFFTIGPVGLRKKWAGAGLARKRGMDEAVQRFGMLNRPEGIIVSLDADTLVKKNYLVEIERYFRINPGAVGATINFEHRKDGLDSRHKAGITLYEKYLEYYRNALKFTGYPHAMYTIGSAFAVTAAAYVRRGGMNRRKAGEDFYFLQNLAQMGMVGEISKTKVYPSARCSDRVPFGTGPVMQKWMNGADELKNTYQFDAFKDLKRLFDHRAKFYKISKEDYTDLIYGLPLAVRDFLIEDRFWEEISDLNRNCSAPVVFQDRFFQKFNAFKILKFLNFSHGKYYEKGDLGVQTELLDLLEQ